MTSLPVTRLVIDSNVWISALIFGGQPRRVFEQVVLSGEQIVISAEIISEIRRTLTQKFPDFLPDFEALLGALGQHIRVVQLGAITVKASRDPDDNRVLETAVLGDARVIISGDKDLLVLKKYQNIDIKAPSDWLTNAKQ